MQDFLIEVINFIPSYYPFTEKDGSIGVADFYAQEPVYNHEKLHSDPVYRDFKKTCDVIGVPVGPCNKLLQGSGLDCIRKPSIAPPPSRTCENGPGVALPCRCDCTGACLYRPGYTSDYIEDWDRTTLLELIDSIRKFPQTDTTDDNNTEFDDDYQRMATHELAGNAYWIGLPPSCDGIWITIVDCDSTAENGFKGFYKLSSPTFGIDNQVDLKGRGQRIKIETDIPGVYKRYQIYYSYEFEYKLGITPPNEMTFKLADENIVQNAENDSDNDIEGMDNYSRFCFDEYTKFTMRNCIKFTDEKGTIGDVPCVCDGEFNTTFDDSDTLKYVLKKDVPEDILSYGVFSVENESTGYCMNAAFRREGSTTGTATSVDVLYRYFDAFSRNTIQWNQINSYNSAWEDSESEENWYSWEIIQDPDTFVWNTGKISENCYDCLNKKKSKKLREEVPPCENAICGRVEINAAPDGSVVGAWKALDGPEVGYGNITSNQVLEWDLFSKFGFPTLNVYNPNATFAINTNWYNEIKNRFVESGTFVNERNQFIIPCFPTIACEQGKSRTTNIIDISIPCSSVYDYEDTLGNVQVSAEGTIHKIYVGVDYRPQEGCRDCANCTPSSCCVSKYGFYDIVSSPIGHSFYYPVYSGTDDVNKLTTALEAFNMSYFECNVPSCSASDLEQYYLDCVDSGEGTAAECVEIVVNACIENIDSTIFACDPPVNEYNYYDFTRSGGNWFYKGVLIQNCVEDPSISSSFSCIYEIEPVRPSSSYWVDRNIGQCRVYTTCSDESCEVGCPCSYTNENKRKDPIYFGGQESSTDTCPTTFCSKCVPGLFSKCSCCGLTRIEDNTITGKSSQSASDYCSDCTRSNSNCCPSCCSVCNSDRIDSCNEIGPNDIQSTWKSDEPCGTTKCGWVYWDFMDCGALCYLQERSGDECTKTNDCDFDPMTCNCTYSVEECETDEEDPYPVDDVSKENGGFGDCGSFNNIIC